MKKFIGILSLVCFIAFASHAQTPQTTAPAAKKEASVSKTDDKTATPACCSKANKACCKNTSSAKNCTPEQKAECAKAGAEAKVEKAEVKPSSSKVQVAPDSK